MRSIDMAQVPASNADTYATHDAALWEQFKIALTAIEEDDLRARETSLRYGPNTAWVMAITVQGRDDEYQVIWVQNPNRDGAYIVHLGPSLS